MPPKGSSSAKAAAAKDALKNGTQSKVIVLKLSSDKLAAFGPPPPTPEPVAAKKSRSKSTADSSASTPAEPVNPPSPSDNPSESNAPTPATNAATPTPAGLAPPPNPLLNKRKGIPGPKPGSKRGPQLDANGLPKPRGKPGPKKKPRLDENGAPILNGTTPVPSKLGPKANTGAVNAGLRALDRTGKPCRKWTRKGLQLKSFTGFQWDVATWRAPKKIAIDVNGDIKSESTSTADNKPNDNSALPSEKSNSNADASTPNGAAPVDIVMSSPAPVQAAA